MPNKNYSNSNVVLTFELCVESIKLIGNMNLTIEFMSGASSFLYVHHGADHECDHDHERMKMVLV